LLRMRGPRLDSGEATFALWSATYRVLRHRLSTDLVCRPSFETVATRPPQDEDFAGPAKVGAYECALPAMSFFLAAPPFLSIVVRAGVLGVSPAKLKRSWGGDRVLNPPPQRD